MHESVALLKYSCLCLCYVTIRITQCPLTRNKVMNIRFSLHGTLMPSNFWHHVTKYRHSIDIWQRSTEKYPQFSDLLSDRSWLKFRDIPVLRVRMSASSLSLFGALFSGLVIFYYQNYYFRRCFGHQKKNLFVSVQDFLRRRIIRLQANSQQRDESSCSFVHDNSTQLICISRQTSDRRSKLEPFTAAVKFSFKNAVNVN